MQVKTKNLFISPDEYFSKVVEEAMFSRNMETFPLAQSYLVNLLKTYIHTANLFDVETENGKKTRETLAEMFLKAQNSSQTVKVELLKKLGDVSLYVSGFFGDSFQRKIVDIDYYIEMGGVAYASLANETKIDTSKKVFTEYSKRFLDFVDLLDHISQKSQLTNDENILRLYEKYLKTGSPRAKEILEEKGIITLPSETKKAFEQ